MAATQSFLMNTETTNTPDHGDRPHAEFGPSSLKHVNACAGWQSRGGTNDAAEMGTRIHEAVEVRNPGSLHNEKELDIYNKLLEDMDGAIEFLREKAGQEPVIHQEITLDMSLNGCETFGTADIVAIAGSYAVLHDHKTGVGKVDPPPENWQSTAYAVGVFQKFPEVRIIFASFSLPQRNEILVGEYHRDKLADYILELSGTILLAQQVRPKWANNGTPSWEELEINNGCQYCLHRDRCPALGHTAIEIVKKAKPDFFAETDLDISNIDDPETLAKMYSVAVIIEKWAEGVRAKTVQLAKDGVEFPGLRLKSLGSKKIIVDKQAFLGYASGLGIDTETVLNLIEIPVAKVRDFYAAKAPKGKKTEWSRNFEEGLETERILEKSEPRYTLSQN